MKKNYIIAIILCSLVFLGGMLLQNFLYPNSPETVNPAASSVSSTQETKTSTNEPATVSLVETEADAVPKTEQTFVVETDLIRAVFTNRGGDLISYKLKQHNVSGSTENVEMIKNTTEMNRTLAISLGGYSAPILDTIFDAKEDDGKNGEKLISFVGTVSFKNASGEVKTFKLSKHFRFLPNEYLFELAVTIEGGENFEGLDFGNTSYTIRTAPQIGPDWDKNDRYDFRRFSLLINGKRKDMTVKAGEVKPGTGGSSLVAVSGKYFIFAVIPDATIDTVNFSADASGTQFETENTQAFISQPAMRGSALQNRYKVYIGPSGENYLYRYSNPSKNAFAVGNLGLENLASSSGVLAPVIIVLKYLLQFVFGFVKNWGVAIIIVTVFIKLLLLPISVKSMVGTQKIQPYQAKISEIQQKYRSNPQKMQEELGKIYKQAGYTPGCASGCLPLVVQFAVIIAMFQLFNNYFEFRGAVFIPGWISDLSVGDSVYRFKNALPILNWTDLRLLPIIYVATQYISTLLTRNAPQPQQTQGMMFMMMYVAPAIFFFMLYNAPSGLFVHWIVSNILMIFQQFITNAIIEKEKSAKKAK
jgi:inner membrane protein oxaA